jgi:adenylate cyclase class 2
MKQEVEILYQVNQTIESAQEILDAIDAKKLSSKRTVDEYFYNKATSQFLPKEDMAITECLRIRQAGDAAYYTYKKDIFLVDGAWSHSDEYETGVDDPETLRQALLKQQYTPLVVVDCQKTKYMWKEYEITLEDVTNLGVFLEIEHVADQHDDIALVKAQIREDMKKLGFTTLEEVTTGKPEFLLRKNGLPR